MVNEKPMANAEMREAIQHLLQRDEERIERKQKRALRRERRKQKEKEDGVAKLVKSIEVTKWCVLSISTVMALSMIIGIAVIMEVEREVERIKLKVEVIQSEAEKIREKIRHPLETIGSGLGRRLEGNVKDFIDSNSESE
jgi:hypothetical protein